MKRFCSLAACASLALLLVNATAQAQWGTIKGRVVWGGAKAPEPVDLTPLVEASPDKTICLAHGKIFADTSKINPKNNGFQWVFVWLGPANVKDLAPLPIHPKLKDPPKDPVIIDQPICWFIPHAVGMREGQVLVAKNSAKVPHNFMWTGPDGGGNPLMPPGAEFKLDNLKASKIPTTISCTIHKWMQGYVRVFDHPYFAVTDADGSFTIADAPAGKYRLIIWNGTIGYRGGVVGRGGEAITIEADKTTDLGEKKFAPAGS